VATTAVSREPHALAEEALPILTSFVDLA